MMCSTDCKFATGSCELVEDRKNADNRAAGRPHVHHVRAHAHAHRHTPTHLTTNTPSWQADIIRNYTRTHLNATQPPPFLPQRA